MKKIIITILLIGAFATTSIFAYDYNLKMNTEEYKSMLNTYIAEMNAEIEATKQKTTIGSILFDGGIENGYIKPSINNDAKLKDCVSGLVDNIKDTNIIDRKLQNKHDELMKAMTELTTLLNDTIECKTDILNSNNDKLKKAQILLSEDEKKLKEVNKKIDEINKIYIQINNTDKNNI